MGKNISEREKALAAQNVELLPSQEKDRNLKGRDLFILCSVMIVNVVGLVIPGQVYLRGGVSPLFILLATFFGFSLVTVLIILSGDIGTRYGIPFVVMIRDCFGKKGVIIGSLARFIVCITWTGVLIFFGSEAINSIMKVWLGVEAFVPIFVIFAAAQLFNASRNIRSMSNFSWFAMPVLAFALIALVSFLLKESGMTLPAVFATGPFNLEDATKGHGMITIVAIFSGGWLSEALNGSDLSRKLVQDGKDVASMSYFKRNKKMILAFSIGFIATGILLTIAGITSAILTNESDPVKIINTAFANKPIALAVGCLIIVIAQWSTNTAANIFPATLILLNTLPKLTFAKATWIVGIISCLLMPWKLANNLDYVQMVFSALLGPILAIMLSHYYIVRKCVIDVDSLYDGSLPDWKMSGLIALAAGLIAGIVFNKFAFFAGFPVAGIVYVVLEYVFVEKNGEVGCMIY